MNNNYKRLLILNIPYIIIATILIKLCEAWRYTQGYSIIYRVTYFKYGLELALSSPLVSFEVVDIFYAILGTVILKLFVYARGKSGKKYRKGREYGSARFGTHQDIEPFMDKEFKENVILTQTESLTMKSRVSNWKNSRNKNVLVIGGSGSGKTRFWLKPNLMQCHSSYVVTDPKGYNI